MLHIADSKIDELIMRLDFRDPTPEVVDLSPKDSLVSTFQESKIECLPSDKVRFHNFSVNPSQYLR